MLGDPTTFCYKYMLYKKMTQEFFSSITTCMYFYCVHILSPKEVLSTFHITKAPMRVKKNKNECLFSLQVLNITSVVNCGHKERVNFRMESTLWKWSIERCLVRSLNPESNYSFYFFKLNWVRFSKESKLMLRSHIIQQNRTWNIPRFLQKFCTKVI